MTVNTSDNRYGTAQLIVAPTVAEGANYTTIASALTAATSGQTIFIRPGTYTENLTLKAGVNLSAFGSDSSLNGTGKVIISGTCTMTTAGSVTISGIQLQTNSAVLLAVTGSAASIVNLNNCYINCSNNTGITYSSSSASSSINIYYCVGDIGTTGIALISSSGAGAANIFWSRISNSGGSSTASTASAGTVTLFNSNIAHPITTSGTAGFGAINSNMDCSAQNATAATIGGSGTNTSKRNVYASGTASALSVGSTLASDFDQIGSSNTNAVTGAGTLTYRSMTFGSSSNKINTTTQSGGLLQGGLTQAPSAGFIGEVLQTVVGAGSAVSLTVSGTAYDVATVSLTAGIWNVSGLVIFTAAAITGTNASLSISATSATAGTLGDNRIANPTVPTAGSVSSLTLSDYRVTITTTTSYYLVAIMNFTVGAPTAYGRITATRVG
jgi:hypothetical protein